MRFRSGTHVIEMPPALRIILNWVAWACPFARPPMQRHHSLGTATLVALMAAHRDADRSSAARPTDAFRQQVTRTLSRLEDDCTLVHNSVPRIGPAPPMVATSRLRH